ncbi:hypothetical protein [Phreatobacter sp. AB_2022a]|uniref:hypothetical protein n=1 Tax=Phreatobacter sp. AB_2022a TaxID=3003134 RepID=UPI0022871F77|nr:hypothetical protein [Phreatobacter sp. AB_2022a]MCZ0735010.1 hypothetical protein [Phreatobacter sp. AB_2022a]
MATEYFVVAGVLALVALAFGGLEFLLLIYATITRMLSGSAAPRQPRDPAPGRRDDGQP